ncbi:hypothetical protein BG015_003841 [Linnemannia schmuckeri]|uniref:Fork-head domain-containing protein n=1 Tax=Linnemannia schmuckeri TaxID=64567 RepID=A0A9P5RJ87_9FUNG|nr:hypothetical protein BG015_003841 [Linnemannia schmuckeri]
MTSEHAERTSVSSHVNADEPYSSCRGPPYGVSRTSSSSHLPPHSYLSTASPSPVSGSISAHAPSSASAAASSVARTDPAGSTTSPVTVVTTSSGELKTTRRRRRPNESYSTIIIKAIRNSPFQRLKLSEIYDYVSREIPTMDGNDKGWQNTVRHNLSHNKCFRRIVIKDENLPSGSADEDDGDSKLSGTGKSSKQVKRGKGGCWVLVSENLEESMSSSRPKKSSTDQGQSPAALGAGSGGSMSSTRPQHHHHASYPYLAPHYPLSPSSSSAAIVNQPGSSTATFQPFNLSVARSGQHNYNSSGDEKGHDSEGEDDNQSVDSVLSADRENDDDYEGDEAMDEMEDESVSHSSSSSSSSQSSARSPSALSLSATPSPMEFKETDGGNGGLSSSSSPTTGRRRPGMSIQTMLN